MHTVVQAKPESVPNQPGVHTFARFRKRAKKSLPLLVMTLPGILFVFLFSYVPMFGIIIAFKDYKFQDGILGSKWVGWKNFEFLFTSEHAWRITYNTIYLNFLFIATGLIAAVSLAIMMNEVKSRWANRYLQSSFFLPNILSWVVVAAFVVPFMAQQTGLINQLITALGFEQVDFYSRPELWPLILVLISIWKGAGYNSLIYLAAIMGISHEYYESARMDGATKRQQIIYITLPLLKPLMIILTILAIGKIFYADFGMFFNLIGNSGQLFPTTDVIDTYVFRALRSTGDVGMASAAGLYQSVVGFILVLTTNFIVRKLDRDSSLF
ncbi:ABC transporter permease [Paenibacillus gansuensis]|uniref:ABC transporter permease n=1 Tax=Paenibacillus gansuensis TaxID=306542 RepID=A0ABW5P9W6_9BACL